jgi:hypothetical protein
VPSAFGVPPFAELSTSAFGSVTTFGEPVLSCTTLASSSVPLPPAPTSAKNCCSCGFGAAGAGAGSGGAVDSIDRTCIGDDVSVDTGWAGASGAAGAASAGCVVSGIAGSCSGVPIWSSTTSPFANGSFGCALCFFAAGACECTSLTTGRRRCTAWRTGRGTGWATCFAAGAFAAWRSGGSGAWACTFGTRNSGRSTAGTVNAGSGVGGGATERSRQTAARGLAYMRAKTRRPRPAHQ